MGKGKTMEQERAPETKEGLQKEIVRLKKEKKAVILAHNYQITEIQEIADFIGDSLELSREAMKVDAKTILFCGVNFMAENAKILNPEKKVLIPDTNAKCPMAAMLTAEDVLAARKKHPKAAVVLYVNTLAEAKAQADITCTSANVMDVINSVKNYTVLFGPDRNLVWYAQQRTRKKLVPLPERGYCYVHKLFMPSDIVEARAKYPGCYVVVHPECNPEVQTNADDIAATSGMMKIAKETGNKIFVFGTEMGLIERARREIPGKEFYPLSTNAICIQQKKHTLEKVLKALRDEEPEVNVDKKVAEKARNAILKMIEVMRNPKPVRPPESMMIYMPKPFIPPEETDSPKQ